MAIELPPDFLAFLRLLVDHDVDFVVIGGYAVAAHGYPRATQDLDIWVSTDPDNVTRVMAAVRAFGFTGNEVHAGLFEQGNIVRMGHPPMRLELLTEVSGLEFDGTRSRALSVDFDGLDVPLISLADLRTNKAAAGRPKDLDDLENLP